MMMLLFVQTSNAQKENPDSLKSTSLSEVVVTETYQQIKNKTSALHIEVAGSSFLRKNFTGNLVQAISNIPGVHSMDIGSGFSKPMIRGMGFNRITVVENGLKLEGQQWGADHGLEIDVFSADQVNIKKGSASLLYGSDAMGGVIELIQSPLPALNQVWGEVALLSKSVNQTMGGSLMLGIKKDAWFAKLRYSQQNFGDYRIPTDTVVYLTQRIPIYKKKLKNTAGIERDFNFSTGYKKERYESSYTISNVYQKTGFFPGAHGIPDVSRVQDDGDSRNIDMPYSKVNHLKITSSQRYGLDNLDFILNLGYQNNHREEWSLFHTHYGNNQPVPDKDPDKELAFDLNTYSSNSQAKLYASEKWEYISGWDMQYQQNTISGYSFLIPKYNRFTTGISLMANFKSTPDLLFNGGLRYDYGKIKASPYVDYYLAAYLKEQNYNDALIEQYKWRSYPINRNFGDYSASVGLSWNPQRVHLIQANIGHSFRLPGAHELASNGVHHGTFRHELGDSNLSSEKGWQLDASYMYEQNGISVRVSPFASWFSNYIYLKPTGEWSILPHAGQIYQYTGAEAIFAGSEISFGIDFMQYFNYQIKGDYVYTYNRDEHVPLSFSPPASMSNTLTWQSSKYEAHIEVQSIAKQTRVAKNEDPTSGVNLLNLGASANIGIGGTTIEATFSARNILDTKYYNHLSFYRKVEIPEPGRNFQILIKIPFKYLLK